MFRCINCVCKLRPTTWNPTEKVSRTLKRDLSVQTHVKTETHKIQKPKQTKTKQVAKKRTQTTNKSCHVVYSYIPNRKIPLLTGIEVSAGYSLKRATNELIVKQGKITMQNKLKKKNLKDQHKRSSNMIIGWTNWQGVVYRKETTILCPFTFV